MYYVYARYVKTGMEYFVDCTFDTAEEAIKHIAKCYEIDKDNMILGVYYYFMQKH